MAPHSSTLAWKIPRMEEPGGLQSMGSLRVRHDWATSLSLFPFMHWRRKWQPTPVFLPGESQGQRSLAGYCPYHHKESDTTERLHFHFSLSCTGEGNGNPLQCSCLENPRDGGACGLPSGVAQSRTRLKRLSSSSKKHMQNPLIIHLASSRTQLANTKMPNSVYLPSHSFQNMKLSQHEGKLYLVKIL